MSHRTPNIFEIVVDQLWYFPQYESDELVAWRDENLHFMKTIKALGTEFHNHFTNATACVPSRTTMQTGVYPNVHGSYSTDGAAKNATDPLMKWLPPFTVPTMGNYLRGAGYKTKLLGKWHVTDASLKGLSGNTLPTFDYYGNPIQNMEDLYKDKNVLDAFGYEGWVGPEPHGRLGVDSASSAPVYKVSRDIKIANQVISELQGLQGSRKPWFLCANLVDPHDIVLFGDITKLRTLNFTFNIDPTLPAVMWKPEFELSMNEDLATKPAVQTIWRNLYPTAFQPISSVLEYWKFYYTCLKRVDEQLMRIWNQFVASSEYNNTVVIFTSDHGNLLGGHGKQFQKWYGLQEEVIHVPLIIASPLFNSPVPNVYDFTSHIDLLPTMLDFAGANVEKIRSDLSKQFSLAVPLPGRSIRSLISGGSLPFKPIYSMTEDDITRGNNQQSLLGVPYVAVSQWNGVAQPSSVETIRTIIDGQTWKLVFYYLSTRPLRQYSPQFFEMYNLTTDPLELHNVYSDPALVAIKNALVRALVEQSFVLNEMLNELNVPGAPLVTFP